MFYIVVLIKATKLGKTTLIHGILTSNCMTIQIDIDGMIKNINDIHIFQKWWTHNYNHFICVIYYFDRQFIL